MESKNLSDLIEEYQNVNNLYRLEGETGLENMNKITRAIGYKDSPFHRGSSLESFLMDNPGVMEKIVEWIGEQEIDEWKEEIETHLPSYEE